MPPDEELAQQFNAFRLEYEHRHSDLAGRVARLETIVVAVVTRADLECFKTDITQKIGDIKTDIVKQISEIGPVKKDVEWLVKWFWFLLGAVVTVLGGLALAAIKIWLRI